jgi:hypothetical protein
MSVTRTAPGPHRHGNPPRTSASGRCHRCYGARSFLMHLASLRNKNRLSAKLYSRRSYWHCPRWPPKYGWRGMALYRNGAVAQRLCVATRARRSGPVATRWYLRNGPAMKQPRRPCNIDCTAMRVCEPAAAGGLLCRASSSASVALLSG